MESWRQAVKKVGFEDLIEAGLGGDMTTCSEAEEWLEAYRNGEKKTTSCCPGFVNMIRKHYPDLADMISTTVSPMCAVSRMIKAKDPDAVTVFVGPCVAKKSEVADQKIEGNADYALNYNEILAIMKAKDVELETAETQKEKTTEAEETPKVTQAVPRTVKATGKKEEKSSEKKEKKLSEEELYRTFYDGYVEDENLQVIQDGYVADYDFNTGYANDLLLSAAMEDFGGNGNKELLLIRTRAKEKDENSSNYTDVKRPLYMELYGIDDQKVTLRKELEIPDTDLNTYEDSIEEKLELRKKEGSYYLYRSGRWSPAHGASDYLDTFIKMSETDMVQECNLRWCFGATYGTCQINGRDSSG